MDDDRQVFVKHNGQLQQLNTYRLRTVQPRSVGRNYQYEGNTIRHLTLDQMVLHQFLFDVNFGSTSYALAAPGIKSSSSHLIFYSEFDF